MSGLVVAGLDPVDRYEVSAGRIPLIQKDSEGTSKSLRAAALMRKIFPS